MNDLSAKYKEGDKVIFNNLEVKVLGEKHYSREVGEWLYNVEHQGISVYIKESFLKPID